jgi:hypothetical protein
MLNFHGGPTARTLKSAGHLSLRVGSSRDAGAAMIVISGQPHPRLANKKLYLCTQLHTGIVKYTGQLFPFYSIYKWPTVYSICSFPYWVLLDRNYCTNKTSSVTGCGVVSASSIRNGQRGSNCLSKARCSALGLSAKKKTWAWPSHSGKCSFFDHGLWALAGWANGGPTCSANVQRPSSWVFMGPAVQVWANY